jgi:hypothetical protein
VKAAAAALAITALVGLDLHAPRDGAAAVTGEESHSDAVFLDASLLTGDLGAVAGIGGARADYVDGASADPADVDDANLDTTALGLLTLPLPDLEIGVAELLQLGLVQQQAEAHPDGASTSQATTTDLTVDLTQLLGGTPVISSARIGLGAVGSEATLPADGALTRTTTIADATATLESPAVGALVTGVDGAIATLNTTVDGLTDVIEGAVVDAVGGIVALVSPTGLADSTTTVTVDSRLDEAVADLLDDTLSTDLVAIDLATGTITVNLAGGIDLNDLPPNSTLLSPEVLQAVSGDIAALLAQLQTDIDAVLDDAAGYVDVTITSDTVVTAPIVGTELAGLSLGYAGTLRGLVDGSTPLGLAGTGLLAVVPGAAAGLIQTAVATAIAPILDPAVATAGAAVDGVVTTATDALGPILDVVAAVAAIDLNVHNAGDGLSSAATVTAVQVVLLSGGATELDLATSSVGPNVQLDFTPTVAATDVAAGEPTAVSGGGWPAATRVSLQVTAPDGTALGDPLVVTTDADGAIPADATYPIPVDAPAGTYTITAVNVGIDGAPGDITAAGTFDVTDETPPGPPAITAAVDGAEISDRPVVIDGTAPADAATVTVVLTTPDGGTTILEDVPVTDGAWTAPAGDLPDGDYSAVATAFDAAGNESAPSNEVDFTVDTVAPGAPVIIAPADGSSTIDPAVTVAGTAPADAATVTVILTTPGGSATTFADVPVTNGAWSLPVGPLADGDHSAVATAFDAAGNESAASNTVDFAVDTVDPVVEITSPEIVDTLSPAVAGTVDDPSATVDVTIADADGAEVFQGPATVDPDTGAWTVDVTLPEDGTYTATATATDPAGNTATDTQGLVADTLAPVVRITSPATADSLSPTVSGTLDDPAAAVTVVLTDADGTVVFEGPATVDPGTGDWTVEATLPEDGTYTVTATATDPAGNEGADAQELVADTVDPVIEITSPGTVDTLTPTIAGTVDDPAATVDVEIADADGVVVFDGPATVDPDTGDWSADATLPEDGTYTVTVTATDEAGNTGTDTQQLAADTTAPEVEITSPAVVDTLTPSVSGALDDPTATVDVTIVDADGTVIFDGPATVTDGGAGTASWTVDVTLPEDGVYTVTATATDPATNTGTDTKDLVADTTAPVVQITSPELTDTLTPTVSGTLDDPTAAVHVVIAGGDGEPVFEGPATVDPDTGDWTVEATLPRDGVYTVSATATDPAGNTAADAQELTADTVAPVIQITSPEIADTLSPTVAGALDDPTATVDVVITDADGTVVFDGPAAVDPDTGGWSVDVTLPEDGHYTVTATATDPAGNAGADAQGLTADTDAPAVRITSPAVVDTLEPTISGTLDDPSATVAVVITDTDGTVVFSGPATVDPGTGDWTVDGTLPEDGRYTVTATATDLAGHTDTDGQELVADTTVTAPVITAPADRSTIADDRPVITGTGEAGATIQVTIDGKVVGTVTVTPGGTWSFPVPEPLADGPHVVTAIQTDGAGNVSAPSRPVSFTVDATAEAPVIRTPENGASTADTTPTVSGTAPAEAVTVDVAIRGAGGSTVAIDDVPVTGGRWSAAAPELADGAYTAVATATDARGNVSADSNAVVFTVDTAIDAPVITRPADGSVTDDSTPVIVGTAEPGAAVVVTVADGAGDTTEYEVAADEDGRWTVPGTDELADGAATVDAVATDAAGNTAAARPVAFEVDTAVAAPVITAPVDGATLTDATPRIAGTGEPGATVEVTIDGTAVGEALVGPDGTWSLELAEPLREGSHTATATQTDAAGSTSRPSAPVEFSVDARIAPPVITSPADGSSTRDVTPVISGTGEPGGTVTVTDGTGRVLGTAGVSAQGRWSLVSAAVTDGTHTITAVHTDADGRPLSSVSSAVAFTVDTVAPTAPVITDPDGGDTVTDPTPPISGTGEPGNGVIVVITDEDGDETEYTGVVGADGTWTITPTTPLSPGRHSVVVTQIDGAGNVSPASAATVFTLADAGAPAGSGGPGDRGSGADGSGRSNGSGDGLAATGGPAGLAAPAGALMLLGALVLLLAARRRQRSAGAD